MPGPLKSRNYEEQSPKYPGAHDDTLGLESNRVRPRVD